MWLLGALLAWLVAAPIGMLVLAALTADATHMPASRAPGLGAFARAWLDPATWGVMGTSLQFAAGSCALGLAIAALFAWAIERTDVPGRRLLFIAVLAPMAIPGMIYATAWTQLLNSSNGLLNVAVTRIGFPQPRIGLLSLGGMILVQGLALASHAYLLIAAAFAAIDPSWEEQSRIAGRGAAGSLWRITLPLLRPALLAAAIYFFLVCIETFDVPGMIGLSAHIEVLSTRIYWATHPESGQLPDYGVASALALLLLLIALGLMRLHRGEAGRARRFVTITARGYRPRRVRLGRWRWPLLGLLCAILVPVAVLPLFMLVWRSLLRFYVFPSTAALNRLTWFGYRSVLGEPGSLHMLANTALVAGSAAVATVGLAAAIAFVSVRARSGVAGPWLRRGALLPQAIPSVVLGFAVMMLYLMLPIGIYGTIWIIALALTTKYLAGSAASLIAAQMQIAPELWEASALSGAGAWRTWRLIVAPLLAPAFANVALWVLIHAIRELAIAIMLYSPASSVVATQVWALWEGGQMTELCALGVLATALLVCLLSLPALVRLVHPARRGSAA